VSPFPPLQRIKFCVSEPAILIMFACRHNDLIESAENTSTSEKESLAEQLAQVNYVPPPLSRIRPHISILHLTTDLRLSLGRNLGCVASRRLRGSAARGRERRTSHT
jgi:hypothetical protein